VHNGDVDIRKDLYGSIVFLVLLNAALGPALTKIKIVAFLKENLLLRLFLFMWPTMFGDERMENKNRCPSCLKEIQGVGVGLPGSRARWKSSSRNSGGAGTWVNCLFTA